MIKKKTNHYLQVLFVSVYMLTCVSKVSNFIKSDHIIVGNLSKTEHINVGRLSKTEHFNVGSLSKN